MNSPIKLPPLPPLPPIPREIIIDEDPDGGAVYGQDIVELKAWATTYAEQAVREALAALKIDERAEFEAAVQEEYGTSASSMLLRDADGDYLTLNTEWVFWLKRAALTAAPPKENNHAEGADK